MKKSVVVESSAYLPKKKSLLSEIKRNLPLLIMLIPGFVMILLFSYKPMYGILIAFKDYKFKDGVLGSAWAGNHGFEHFIRLFKTGDFTRIFFNTIKISFLKTAFGFAAPIILALMFNEMRSKVFKRVTQTLSYLPHFFSWVVLGGIFKLLFASVGPVNTILQSLGASEPVSFFGDGQNFVWLIVWTSVWQGVGWGTIIYLAALTGIDESLYEAAYIDGASRWKQVWHISIPSIMGTVSTVLILNMGSILNAGFDQIYNMYNATVYETSDILDTYSLRLLQDGRYELGTALGLFKSAVGLMLVMGTNWLVKFISKDEYGVL